VNTANLLEELVARIEGGRVRAAFFSTFTFSPAYFGAQPLRALTREGLDVGNIPITIVVDGKQFRGCERGYEVVKAPVNLWHPKAVLLMVAQPGATAQWTVVAVGSGNLTRAGWEHNQELFVIDCWDGWCVPRAIAAWFEEPWLRNSGFAQWCRTHGVRQKNGDGSATLLSSLHVPLWPRLELAAAGHQWTEAHVIAPFSDQSADLDAEPGGKGGAFFKSLVDHAAPGATLHVYLRRLDLEGWHAVGMKSVFEDLAEMLGGRSRLKLHLVASERGRILHAKLFAWRVRGSWTVVLGSANATRAAMCEDPGTGNVELAWEFRRVGGALPAGLLPGAPIVPLADVHFHPPAFDSRPLWDAVEAAVFDPRARRVRLRWRAGANRALTEVRLSGRAVDPARISLTGTEDRALEVVPRRADDRRTHRTSWVPIQIPDNMADDGIDAEAELGADDWLRLLGNPDMSATTLREGERGVARVGSRRPNGSSGEWQWGTRVAEFEGRIVAVADAVRDAETHAAVARLVRVLDGAWRTHDPRTAGTAAERAWRSWVRAGLIDALSVVDGRSGLHRPLAARRKRWLVRVDHRLIGGRDV
jgi:hypothetical protein